VRDCGGLNHLGGGCVLCADNPFMDLARSHRTLGWRVRPTSAVMGACGEAALAAAGWLAFPNNSLSRRTDRAGLAGDASRYASDVVNCDVKPCFYGAVVEVGHAAGQYE
jgi:hypothetical protein